MPLADDIDVPVLVTLSDGFSGAEVVSACTEAAILAISERVDQVEQRHVSSVMRETKPQITRGMLEYYSRVTEQFYS
jgi:transitional endoplasmic reticulum ATPase